MYLQSSSAPETRKRKLFQKHKQESERALESSTPQGEAMALASLTVSTNQSLDMAERRSMERRPAAAGEGHGGGLNS
jgi:hypothetical protein